MANSNDYNYNYHYGYSGTGVAHSGTGVAHTVVHQPSFPSVGVTSGTSSATWYGYDDTSNTTNITVEKIRPYDDKVSVEGDLDITGDIIKDGVGLFEAINDIKKELGLPQKIKDNPERRATHQRLQELYDLYQEEEKKLEFWETLKEKYKGK